jgi:hypothetical protein
MCLGQDKYEWVVVYTSTWQSWLCTLTVQVPTVAGRSGQQLMMVDSHALGRPILVNLSEWVTQSWLDSNQHQQLLDP